MRKLYAKKRDILKSLSLAYRNSQERKDADALIAYINENYTVIELNNASGCMLIMFIGSYLLALISGAAGAFISLAWVNPFKDYLLAREKISSEKEKLGKEVDLIRLNDTYGAKANLHTL